MYGSRLLDSYPNATMELFGLFSALVFLPSYATGCENRPLAKTHQLRAQANVLDIGRKNIRLETRQVASAPCNVSKQSNRSLYMSYPRAALQTPLYAATIRALAPTIACILLR
jgi:hypothetical protein